MPDRTRVGEEGEGLRALAVHTITVSRLLKSVKFAGRHQHKWFLTAHLV